MSGWSITALSDQPGLAPLVARWKVAAFFNYPGGYTVEEMTALMLAPAIGPEETLILYDAGEPVGTAALVHSDLDTRPDLTPWLAGVWVEPAFRNRGHASALVRHVEAFALASRVPTIWLYTVRAEPLYRKLGWERCGTERDQGHDVALMKRTLSGPGSSGGI